MKSAKNRKAAKKASAAKKNRAARIMSVAAVLFALAFLAVIAVPALFLDRKTTISMLERRMLAQAPKVFVGGTAGAGQIAALPREIDAYVTDRFAFRSRLISAMTWFNFTILHKSHDKKLLVGKDKWLFYIDKSLGDEFANFKKSNLFTDEQKRQFVYSIKVVNDYCDASGIKFVLLIVPTTSTVYPEQYPFPRPAGVSLVDQVLAALPKNIRDKTIWPLDYFVSKKGEHSQPMYYNNGLHWNTLGCYYAYQKLYEKLKPDFPNIPEMRFKFTPYKDPGEDNYTILWWGLKQFGDFLELLRVEPVDGWGSHYKYLVCNNVEDNGFNSVVGNASKKGKYGIITENIDKSLPTAIVMRDSYFVDLEPFTSSMFSYAEYVWTQPEKRSLKYLDSLQIKPDVFICEIGERGLEAILMTEPGVFPYD